MTGGFQRTVIRPDFHLLIPEACVTQALPKFLRAGCELGKDQM